MQICGLQQICVLKNYTILNETQENQENSLVKEDEGI